MAGMPAIMSVTPAAQARVRQLLARAADKGETAAALRVGVEKGGCAGMSYKMDVVDETKAGDEVVEFDGGKVVIDAKAILYLLGTQMDFETTKLRSGFVFNNPNQTSACGCGESVELKPATLPAQH